MTGKGTPLRCDPRAIIMGSGVPRWNDTQKERRRDDEVHDYSQGQQELGGRSHAEQELLGPWANITRSWRKLV